MPITHQCHCQCQGPSSHRSAITTALFPGAGGPLPVCSILSLLESSLCILPCCTTLHSTATVPAYHRSLTLPSFITLRPRPASTPPHSSPLSIFLHTRIWNQPTGHPSIRHDCFVSHLIFVVHHIASVVATGERRPTSLVHKLLVPLGRDGDSRHQPKWPPPTFKAFTGDPSLPYLVTARPITSPLAQSIDSAALATPPDPSFHAHGRTKAAAKGSRGRTSCPSSPVIRLCREAQLGLGVALDVLRPLWRTSLSMANTGLQPIHRAPKEARLVRLNLRREFNFHHCHRPPMSPREAFLDL
jgi:hypothetical protein